MSDNTKLIAEARGMLADSEVGGRVSRARMIHDLIDALEAAEIENDGLRMDARAIPTLNDICAERDALTAQLAEAQAVIAVVKGDMHITQMTPNPNDPGAYVLGGDAEKALAQSPTDALEAVKHAAWDEGYDSFKFNGHWVTNQSASVRKWVANPIPNPYRPTEPEADHA